MRTFIHLFIFIGVLNIMVQGRETPAQECSDSRCERYCVSNEYAYGACEGNECQCFARPENPEEETKSSRKGGCPDTSRCVEYCRRRGSPSDSGFCTGRRELACKCYSATSDYETDDDDRSQSQVTNGCPNVNRCDSSCVDRGFPQGSGFCIGPKKSTCYCAPSPDQPTLDDVSSGCPDRAECARGCREKGSSTDDGICEGKDDLSCRCFSPAGGNPVDEDNDGCPDPTKCFFHCQRIGQPNDSGICTGKGYKHCLCFSPKDIVLIDKNEESPESQVCPDASKCTSHCKSTGRSTDTGVCGGKDNMSCSCVSPIAPINKPSQEKAVKTDSKVCPNVTQCTRFCRRVGLKVDWGICVGTDNMSCRCFSPLPEPPVEDTKAIDNGGCPDSTKCILSCRSIGRPTDGGLCVGENKLSCRCLSPLNPKPSVKDKKKNNNFGCPNATKCILHCRSLGRPTDGGICIGENKLSCVCLDPIKKNNTTGGCPDIERCIAWCQARGSPSDSGACIENQCRCTVAN